jgi:hypothetical protein
MRTKLAALLAGVALFGLAGMARADALAPANTQALTLPSLTDTWSLPTDTQPATQTGTQVVTLTDDQMDEVTAGRWVYFGRRYFVYRFNGRLWYSRGAYPIWLWY